jgi:hypothetical protein
MGQIQEKITKATSQVVFFFTLRVRTMSGLILNKVIGWICFWNSGD